MSSTPTTLPVKSAAGNRPVATSTISNGWFVGILLLALILRVGAAYYWHRQALAENHFLRLGDSHGYWILAGHIARGEPYEYGSSNAAIFRAPMLPLVLAPFTRINDPSTAILCARVVLGSILGTISVGLVALLAGRLAGKKTAITAAALACCYPSAIGMSVIILSEMLFVPLMLSFLWLWNSAWRAPSSATRFQLAALTGVVGGIAILTRPSWLLFVPFVAVLGLVVGKGHKIQMGIIAAMGLGICLTMAPWWIRNYSITGKFVLTTLQVGPSLYDSLHQGASGGSDEGMQFMRRIEQEQFEADQHSDVPLESTLEWRINRRAQQAAVSWAKDNPGQVLRLAWAKFCKTWSLWPDGGQLGSPVIRLTMASSSLAALLLAIWASFKLGHTHRLMLAILWSPCLYFTLLHMVFVGSVRYREPAVMVLIALAGYALARLISPIDTSLQDSSRVNSALPKRSTN